MKDRIYQFLANVLPTRLVYFAYIRLMAFSTTHDEGCAETPDSIGFGRATKIWERYHA